MRVLLIGDPHLKASSQQLVVKFFDWLHQLVEELKPDFVVNLGDTFHTHNVIRSEVMALVTNHLTWMADKGINYYILVGNHDMAHHKMPEVHAWLPFMRNAHEVEVIVEKPKSGNGFGFIPYIDDPGEFQQVLAKFMETCHTIFCHQTFRGANFGFVTTKEGATVPTDYVGQIVSGHIHKTQTLGCVWYPGTPFAQEAADHNEVKGIYLYDTEAKTADFHKSPLPQWVTSKASPADFETVIAKMDKQDKNHLVIEGPGPEVSAAVDSKAFKDLKKEYGFSVKKLSTSSNKSTRSLKKVATVEDAVVEYVDKIYDGAVDKEKLKARCLAALQ